MASVYIEIFRDDAPLANGTGFFVHRNYPDVKIALFTARHNFTAKDHFTKKPVGQMCIPNRIRVWIPTGEHLEWKSIDKPIRSQGDETQLWHEHPTAGENIDVAALEMSLAELESGKLARFSHFYWELAEPGDYFDVGRPIHIVGFPLKISRQYHAIWTTGFIASEPRIDYQLPDPIGMSPCFLVSCRTWSGQSGSPVVHSPSAYAIRMESGWGMIANSQAPLPHMYTGRLNPSQDGTSDKFSSDLGIVWKSSALQEIFTSMFAD